jgi:hypothetical protein
MATNGAATLKNPDDLMNYAFPLGCKKDEAREKTHYGPWVRKHFMYRHAGNDFSSDRDEKEHRNALRNTHAQDIHFSISTLPHCDDEKASCARKLICRID